MDKHFPGWTLAIGGFLALASILPIVVVFVLRVTGLSSPMVDYEPGSPMKRVETNASTHPMMVRNARSENDLNDCVPLLSYESENPEPTRRRNTGSNWSVQTV